MRKALFPVLLLMVASGCASEKSGQVSFSGDVSGPDLSLQCLLPSEQGYRWNYWGFAEYGHWVQLEDMLADQNMILYRVSGMVEDMSGGEAPGDFSIDLKYIVSDSVLSILQPFNLAMDSDFEQMDLVRLPLVQGNSWNQTVMDRDGNEVNLACEIEDIQEGPPRLITVRYRDIGGSFYQLRVFEEGVGVVSFEKPFSCPDGTFEIGYTLYR